MKLLEETKSRMSLDDLFNQIQEGNLKELDIVVKADVQGSVEALKQSLLKLSNDEVVDQGDPRRRGSYQRIGCDPGFCFQRDHHRI